MKTAWMDVIKRPLVTEKAAGIRETHNQVAFEVCATATKLQIREAIEGHYKVTVTDVNTMIVRGKVKRMGRFEGKRSNWKKAIATLKVGDKIEIAEGV